MSKMYEKIKRYYDTGLWSEERVRNMVIKGIITEEEYKDIVGKDFIWLKYFPIFIILNTKLK